MEAILASDVVDVVGVADPDESARTAAHALVPDAVALSTFDEVMALEPAGVVLATPSAMHAAHCIRALEAGAAVFCQKPLGRHTSEVHAAINAARHANRLLSVDVSYRYTEGLRRTRDCVLEGGIGDVYAIDLTFHNAYGPDKPWFYDLAQSGGGCLLDLGTHLVDFLHWTIDNPVVRASGATYARGRRLQPEDPQVEDYAIGEIELASGAIARLACSWRVPAGCDARIDVSLFGTRGGLAFRNVGGSFYDFVAERYTGTQTEILCSPPDNWGGRAAVAWAQALARSTAFDPEIEVAGRVAATLDALYGRSATPASDGKLVDVHVDGEDASNAGTHADR